MAKLFYKKYGEKGPVVFILHGLFGMLDNWHSIAQKMQEDFTIYALDQRNHGHSPHTETMTYDDMANDLNELMEDLGIEKAHLVGHSMGGKTVMHFANAYPHKLNKLVVVDIAPKAYPNGHEVYFKALMQIIQQKPAGRKEAEDMMSETVADVSIRQFLLKSLYRTQDGSYALRMNVPVIYSFYNQISGAISSDWPINNPTLFIKGAFSNYITEKDHDQIHQMFPNSEIQTVSKAGHWVHAENPEEFIQLLSNFLLA